MARVQMCRTCGERPAAYRGVCRDCRRQMAEAMRAGIITEQELMDQPNGLLPKFADKTAAVRELLKRALKRRKGHGWQERGA